MNQAAAQNESLGVLTKSEHLVQLLQAELRNGQFRAGRKFYSTHAVVRRYQVSTGTARKALLALIGRGYLRAERGAGHFVRADVPSAEVPQATRSTSTTVVLAIVGATGEWGTGVLDQYLAALEQACASQGWALLKVGNRREEIEQALEGNRLVGCWAYGLSEPPAAGVDTALLISWGGSNWQEQAGAIMHVDREEASRLAHEHLWDLGHERTAMVLPASYGISWVKSRGSLLGMRKAYATVGLSWSLEDVIRVVPDEIGRLYERICDAGITGIYCEDWKMTAELYRQASEIGHVIGEQLSLVTSGGNDLVNMLQPRAARVYWRMTNYAAIVVKALQDLEHGQPLPPRLAVPMFLEDGPSARPLMQPGKSAVVPSGIRRRTKIR